jgi:hypothetical protein
MSELDWPAVSFLRADVTPYPRFSHLRELRPLFNRKPYGDWCELFFKCCKEDSDIDWKEAGFALCGSNDVGLVEERFRLATANTNTTFRAVPARALDNQPRETSDLIALEASLAASSKGDGYLCNFSGGI